MNQILGHFLDKYIIFFLLFITINTNILYGFLTGYGPSPLLDGIRIIYCVEYIVSHHVPRRFEDSNCPIKSSELSSVAVQSRIITIIRDGI